MQQRPTVNPYTVRGVSFVQYDTCVVLVRAGAEASAVLMQLLTQRRLRVALSFSRTTGS